MVITIVAGQCASKYRQLHIPILHARWLTGYSPANAIATEKALKTIDKEIEEVHCLLSVSAGGLTYSLQLQMHSAMDREGLQHRYSTLSHRR